MIKVFWRNVFRFVFLVLLQVLILDHIEIGNLITPYLFILFILMLPFETPNWLLLIFGFLLGLSIDLFNNTAGLHASATVFMTFIRPFVLKIISPRDGYEPGSFPRLNYYGFNWFLKYSIILVLAHHMVYLLLESFGSEAITYTILKALLSSVASLVLIMLSQFFMMRKS